MDSSSPVSSSLKSASLNTKEDEDNSNVEEIDQCSSSSDSYQSLTEQVNSLNIENTDFIRPESMNHYNLNTASNIGKTDDEVSDSDEFTDRKQENKQIDKYFIDEEFLKNLETTMSEEEKEKQHQDALNLKTEGNNKFKENLFEDASKFYTQGLNVCPLFFEKDRAVMYANRAASRSKSEKEEDRKGAVEDCSKALELDASYLKAIQRRANLNQQLGNLDEALKDFERVLEIEPYNDEARRAKMFLPQQIEERNEKLKAEMMGKLKDLGNMILKPFGLSTNNFQMNKNDETGGYNISFNQNP